MRERVHARREDDRSLRVSGVLAALASADDLPQLAHAALAAVDVPHSALSLDLFETARHPRSTLAASGVSDYFLTRYEQVGRQADPILEHAVATRRVTDNRAVMSRSRWASLPVYENVFRLHRLTNILYAPVVGDGEVVATLNVGRGDAEGAFSDAELDRMGALAEAVGVAYEWLVRRQELTHEHERLGAALDLCDEAVVITDAVSGRRRLNIAARRLLARVAAGSPGLDDLLPASGSPVSAAVTETTVDLADGTRAQLRCRSAVLEDGVVVSFPRLVDEAFTLPTAIQAGLTPRESDVARLVVEGLHDCEIALELGVSEHTVKQHLKAVYRKLGVRSRVGLVRAVL